MKTILVPTDFSDMAENAAHYAMKLARDINANLLLCHAFTVPIIQPIAAQVILPLIDYSFMKKEANEQLQRLATKLRQVAIGSSDPDSYDPEISYISESGTVIAVLEDLVAEKSVCLVVMDMNNNSHEMINKANFPMLFIPHEFQFNEIKKIAFATDLSESNVNVINSLSGLASYYYAEILLAHIFDDKIDHQEHQKRLSAFLNDIACKINYPKIYYRQINRENIDAGLDWLMVHGLVDMLAMVHHHDSFMEKIFTTSHTQNIARHIEIPLLVFPSNQLAIF
ncbi:nucleotide-binding universal stress UspA family protein [Pedobacter sp. CG_S7]|uniref:universal stress protein n=1 Tax=Pedobacter sp. CG_S7 TaxID=3143930 RepID=UPI0033930744